MIFFFRILTLTFSFHFGILDVMKTIPDASDWGDETFFTMIPAVKLEWLTHIPFSIYFFNFLMFIHFNYAYGEWKCVHYYNSSWLWMTPVSQVQKVMNRNLLLSGCNFNTFLLCQSSCKALWNPTCYWDSKWEYV